MKVNIAAQKMKSGKMVRETRSGSIVFRMNNHQVDRKVLNFKWEPCCNVREFEQKYANEKFEEVVFNSDLGLGFEKKVEKRQSRT